MRNLFYFIVLSVFLSSCEKDEKSANEALYDYMKEMYLWCDDLPAVSPDNYKDPYSLMKALRHPNDTLSVVESYEHYISHYYFGTYYDFGIIYTFDINNEIIILYVYNYSPFKDQKIDRGWIINEINGIKPYLISSKDLFGSNQNGLKVTFKVTSPDKLIDITFDATKKQINYSPILASSIFNRGSNKVGYLMIGEFPEHDNIELDTLFSNFSTSGVTNIICDFRYNSSRRIDYAAYFVNYLYKDANDENIISTLKTNTKRKNKNITYYFDPKKNATNATRIFFIVTENTSSACEMVINSLRPYVSSIYLVGTPMQSKPVGTETYIFNDTYAFVPVTYKIENFKGENFNFKKINVDFNVSEEIYYPLGHEKENILASILYFIENGSWPTPQLKNPNLHYIKSNYSGSKIGDF